MAFLCLWLKCVYSMMSIRGPCANAKKCMFSEKSSVSSFVMFNCLTITYEMTRRYPTNTRFTRELVLIRPAIIRKPDTNELIT